MSIEKNVQELQIKLIELEQLSTEVLFLPLLQEIQTLIIRNGQKEHIVNYNALLHEYNTEIIISRYNLPYINTIYKKMVKKIVSRIIENHKPTNSLSVIRKKNVFKGSNLLDKLLFIISLSIVLVLIFFIASKINHTDLSNFPIR